MEIGYCTNLINTQPDGTGSVWIDNGKKYGFDYIELPLAQLTALSEVEFSAIKTKLLLAGIACETCNNCFPASIRMTGNDVDYNKIEDYLTIALDRAEQLGVKIIVLGSPLSKRIPEGFGREKAWEQMLYLMRFLDPLVKAKGMIIAVEENCKLETNFINTTAEALKLVKAVDRENIKLLVDFYHLYMENEHPDIILDAGSFIHHVHFSDPTGKGKNHRKYPTVLKEEMVPFINNLKRIRYNRRISLEAFSDDFDHDAPLALAVMKQLIK